MTDEDTTGQSWSDRTRRGLMRGMGLTVGGSLLTAGVLNRMIGTASADVESSSFRAANTPLVESNEGQITAVTIAPVIHITWDNFGEGVQQIDITLKSHVNEKTDLIYDAVLTTIDDQDSTDIDTTKPGTMDFTSTNGVTEITFINKDITDTGGNITESDFSDGTLDAGQSNITPVELELTVDVIGNQNENGSVVLTKSFDVEVQNPDGDTTVDGDANTDSS